MRADMTQEEFESQWKPIPGEDFSLPACHEGMILLKAFADAHPDSFQFIRPEGFVHFEMKLLLGWTNGMYSLVIASRVMPATNSRVGEDGYVWSLSPQVTQTTDRRSFSCQRPSFDWLMIMPND